MILRRVECGHKQRRQHVSRFATLDRILEAARMHGLDSNPEHEIGDLQQALTACWDVMGEDQKDRVLNALELWEE
jgi:hypothetical protein